MAAAGGVSLVALAGRSAARRTRVLSAGPRVLTRAIPATVPPAPPSDVIVCKDVDEVSERLCAAVVDAANEAVAERGAFALAIPGGSILKMLAGGKTQLGSVDWSKVTMAYVNHKCVENTDATATHKKCLDLFLDEWQGVSVITLGGSADSQAEASRYEQAMQDLPESVLPRNGEGMPVFDLTLIGVGDDGHFGSLYPNREEIADASGRWVLPVDMKSPPSITLSPATMLASKKVLVASAGVSEKYPKGKAAAMKVAIEGAEGPRDFPAAALRGRATYLLDAAAASDLSPGYRA